MKSRIYAFVLIGLSVLSAVFVASQEALVVLFPSLSATTIQMIQLILGALASLLATIPVTDKSRSVFSGDAAANIDVPPAVYPALWTLVSWIFSLIFKKKGV